ncbi:pyruvate dehydrogenase (acetyl-transferring), homodimeric type [Xylella fastidiosa]|uniref:pyruvate dehydrogenase (acetyl-transferring), homodimeric type n=1 Tax=Xylella fastidiosa TaxID=2371 RepID=UPI00097AC991|nr:pyruvate dehydrogenase (acetyl-transferring), homodimeric type [Xylella fastidiosa]MDC6413154.1 pyruvate dehydrogenase (acetyl-transferring), homodimeric type [Xylella fastidiosa subsp. multiplex]MDD0863694.1 pyruvate dehydrogenase (acetyl-transferring), homodimeric type [Xylella fastidiosa subsp. multiplex]MDD0865752.1 pyruvate dehydrogenase (acetyl-transferring), homodimeric type [Xylella fastidiosa subsp. multiplex]MDD0872477.1 pyruvate dehydrogenase (acetyl-transferring), homodimeric typ
MNRLKEALHNDPNPLETQEWLESIKAVIDIAGPERAHQLLEGVAEQIHRTGTNLPFSPITEYVNTIPTADEAKNPGDPALERSIRSIIRWNAMATVVRANRKPGDLGGHIASFASSATLYDVGFNHFWRAPSPQHPGDLLYIQGHSSPGIYARAFLEGRISESQLDHFRMEVDGKGISSYPHPWLMPQFWQTPTVSMGLGPLSAIYQAQFMKYLEHRGLIAPSDRKVWCFIGDGESDEPETLGAIALAGREGLDNLIFVVNCNLQRLDGPVRGNGKIIQELEGVFRGGGWNVIKLLWGAHWDPLLAQDTQGVLRKLMMETVDGEYQNCKAFGGEYTRKHFFDKYPETAAMVAHLSDNDIWRLNRGGHDPHKIYAAYHRAVNTQGMPTVILAKTVKGYGMGTAGESLNPTHQTKKLDHDAIKHFRDRFNIPISDQQLDAADHIPFYHPGPDSPEIKYMLARREALGGFLPQRRTKSSKSFIVPGLDKYERLLTSSGERTYSTTMAFVQSLNITLRDKALGPHIVPIVADEARTFGMEGLFRQIGIYAPFGQKYKPVDADQLMYYREDESGQVLQQGITEPGAIASWMAAGTSYSVSDVPMLPFYIYYSMFGFQRIGDIAWQAADMRTRGFLLGGTAGRTTLNGEGLQHEDGHSHLMAGAIPNVRSYDPTFGYEVTVILQHGMKAMMQDQIDEYYYLTLMNENYAHPDMPAGVEQGIIKGMYLLKDAGKPKKGELRVQLLGSGTILREAIAAAELLHQDFGITADIWSCPSFSELRKDGFDAERWNRLHPDNEPRTPYVTQQLENRQGPAIAATDYVRLFADQIRAFVPMHYTVLGTDGFGRSDTRSNLRRFFEVDRHFIAHAAIAALAKEGKMTGKDVARAIEQYNINPEKPNPVDI